MSADLFNTPVNGTVATLEVLWAERQPGAYLLGLASHVARQPTVYAVLRRTGDDSASWEQITADLDHKQMENWYAYRAYHPGTYTADLRAWLDQQLVRLVGAGAAGLTCEFCDQPPTLVALDGNPPDLLCRPCARSQTDGPLAQYVKPLTPKMIERIAAERGR